MLKLPTLILDSVFTQRVVLISTEDKGVQKHHHIGC